jgi:hypothetical protein
LDGGRGKVIKCRVHRKRNLEGAGPSVLNEVQVGICRRSRGWASGSPKCAHSF